VSIRSTAPGEGVDFVRCCICGDHRRVISARHLSKHEIDRETYMAEYRLSPDQLIAKDFRLIQSSRRDYHPYSKRDWVSAIRAVFKKTGNVYAGYLQINYQNIYYQGVWLYGDWDKALLAAGFDPESTRQHSRWTKSKIIKAISRLRNRRIPLNAQYVMKFYPALCSVAFREFGTWTKALRAAGVPAIQTIKKTRLGILIELRDLRESHSKNEIPTALKQQVDHYFGSLRKAVAESKKDRRVVNGWSKPKILALLAEMHKRKLGLGYVEVRRNVPTLLSAAENYFGSWGRALHQAGINPNLYFVHNKWRNSTKRKSVGKG
jgi:hypothetical protein